MQVSKPDSPRPNRSSPSSCFAAFSLPLATLAGISIPVSVPLLKSSSSSSSSFSSSTSRPADGSTGFGAGAGAAGRVAMDLFTAKEDDFDVDEVGSLRFGGGNIPRSIDLTCQRGIRRIPQPGQPEAVQMLLSC